MAGKSRAVIDKSYLRTRNVSERKQAGERLQESEGHFRALIENSSDAIAILNGDGTIRYESPSVERVLGYKPEELIGRDVLEFLHPDDVQSVANTFDASIKNPGQPVQVEARFLHKDGTWRVMEGIGNNLLDDPKVHGIIVNYRDITERKRAEEAVRETERRYKAIFDNRLQMVYINDEQGLFLDANDHGLERLEYTRDDLGKMSFQDILHPEDLPKAFEAVADMLTKGFMEHSIELRVISKSGETIWVETFNIPLERGVDHYVGLGIAHDITERKRMEEALQQREQDYLALLETMFEGIVVVDAETLKVVYGNRRASKMFGFDPVLKNGVGVNILDFVHPEDKEVVIKGFTEDLYQEERRQKYEVRAKTKDGKELWITALGTRTEFQGRLAVLLSTMDVTERKKAEEALRESEEKFRRLVEEMSDGYCVLQGSTVVFANARSAEMFGYTQEEVIGRTIQELLPPAIVSELSEVRAKRQLGDTVPQQYEIALVSKDGTTHPVELGTRVIDYAGKRALSVVIRDISERKQAEEALRYSEQHFRSLIENAQDAIVILSGDGIIRYESPSMARVLGHNPEDRIGKNPFNVVHPDDVPAAADLFAQVLRTSGDRVNTEVRVQHEDGSWRTVEVVVHNLLDDLAVAGVVVNIRDITERKRAEEALQQSEGKLRQYLELSPDAIYINDFNGTFLYGNRAAERMTGYSREELVGKNFLEAGLLPPEYLSQAARVMERNAAGRPTGPDELELIRKDGSRVFVEIATYPIGEGEKTEVIGIARDITERKQAEESISLLSTAVRTSADAISVASAVNGKLLFCNDAFLKQWKVKGDYHSLSYVDCFDVEPGSDILEKAAEATMGGGWTGELTARATDGQTFPISVASSPVIDKEGRIVGLLAIFRDITERKQAEEEVRKLNEELEQRVVERTTQLQAVNKELEAFAYSVSHDLRAPLRSIDGFSQMLLEDYAGRLDEEGKDYLQRVRSASQRMAELIDDTLKLSRVTRGEMRRETIDLSALAQTIAMELQQGQPERQVEFIITPGLVVTGDAHLLRAALENLLGNAWKFTRKRSPATIEFGYTETNGQSAYFVRDNGVGFDMAYADKLFSAFQRLHSRNEFEGTGIGLATVQRIIHRHGGNVWAESAVGQGATFYFTL